MYILSFVLILLYFIIEFNKNISLPPISKVLVLISICLLMHIGKIIISKTNNKKLSNYLSKINIITWFIIYLILILNFTLFDNYFGRGSLKKEGWSTEVLNDYIKNTLNIIPFKTIISFFIKLTNNKVTLTIFMYNIVGNIVAFMPFAFFLPLIFNKQNKTKNFIITMIIIVSTIELLQFITLSGTCDIDDVILNVFGSVIMYKILKTKHISKLIKKNINNEV